jgi:hypothetical protein
MDYLRSLQCGIASATVIAGLRCEMARPRKIQTNVGLKTRNVFLDTQVYRQYGHNLNAKVLQSLLTQLNDRQCTLHITDITRAEIERQIGELAAEVSQSVNKGTKELRRWNSRFQHKTSGVQAPRDDVDPAEMKKNAVSDFNFIFHSWNPVNHAALKIDPKTVFDAYFRRDPPFDHADSKEFPDAFVIAALDQWCTKEKQQMYVITRDAAMKRTAEVTRTLIPLSSLDEFLQIIVQAQDPAVVSRVEGILNYAKTWDRIATRVRGQIGNLGTIYSGNLMDGEIVDHSPGSGKIELLDFHVISISSEQIEAVLKLKAPIEFELQYLDTTYATYDNEDDTYIGAETASMTFETEAIINAFVVIDASKHKVTEVDVLARDIHVEEPTHDHY